MNVFFETLLANVTLQMVLRYRTIQGESQGLYKEKGSKFLAFAYPVMNEEEVKHRLDQLRKEFFDARHHCYAYILNPDKSRYRANDDGEPNHSAGDPILGQIRSKDLTNVLVVVVRYFGGTKLGVSGLIQAYRIAAEEALSKAVIIDVDVTRELNLKYSYDATPEIMKLVKEFDLSIVDQQFSEGVELRITYKLALEKTLFEKLELLRMLGTTVKWND